MHATTDITDPLRRAALDRGVFLRAEALALGINDNDLRQSLRAGVLTRVRHGCYTFTDLWRDLDPSGRHLVLARAAMRRLSGVALSHVSAALAHGLDVWDIDLSRAHVTRLDAGAGRLDGDVVHHEAFTDDSDLVTVLGLPAVTPVRAALETAVLGGTERGLVTASSGLRLGLFGPDDLMRQQRHMSQWPHARPLHIVTRLADGRHESAGEVRCEYLFFRAGLPRPVPQLEIFDERGRLLARVDFAWPQHRLVVEFDGRAKYERFLRPGESLTDVVLREKRREDALREAGWIVVRLTWADLSSPWATVERLRRHVG